MKLFNILLFLSVSFIFIGCSRPNGLTPPAPPGDTVHSGVTIHVNVICAVRRGNLVADTIKKFEIIKAIGPPIPT